MAPSSSKSLTIGAPSSLRRFGLATAKPSSSLAEQRFSLGDVELWMFYVNGGSGVQLTKGRSKPDARSDESIHAVGAVLSPDGKFLYYTKHPNSSKPFDAIFPPTQIVRRNMITGQEDTITNALGNAFRPLLSPDGSQLVYGTRYNGETALRIRDLPTGQERWLKYPVQRDNEEANFTSDILPGYAFTPDGKEIVVSYGRKIHRLNATSGADELIPFTAKVREDVGPKLYFPHRVEEGPVRARVIQDPSQSPDGKRLVFSALTHVYVIDLPRGAPVRLTTVEEREFQPAWSPDGKWIAYVTWAEQGGDIWKARFDGSGAPVRLTRRSGYYSEPVWSPDGSKLVALREDREAHVEAVFEAFGVQNRTEIIWIPAEGGDPEIIMPARGAEHPHFAAQNDRVYGTRCPASSPLVWTAPTAGQSSKLPANRPTLKVRALRIGRRRCAHQPRWPVGSRAGELSTFRGSSTAHRRRRAERECLECIRSSEKNYGSWRRLSRLGRWRQNNYLGRGSVFLPPATQLGLVRAGDERESRFF